MTNKSDDLYRNRVQKKSEAALICLAEDIERQRALEFDKLIQEAEDFEIPRSIHLKLIKIIDEENCKNRRERVTRHIKQSFRICACIIVVCLVTGTFLMTNVEAFREKVYNLFFPENKNYVELIPLEVPYDPDEILPPHWINIWYPNYLPEGYKLSSFQEYEGEKELYFQDGDSIYYLR